MVDVLWEVHDAGELSAHVSAYFLSQRNISHKICISMVSLQYGFSHGWHVSTGSGIISDRIDTYGPSYLFGCKLTYQEVECLKKKKEMKFSLP